MSAATASSTAAALMQATTANVRPTRKSICLSSWSPRLEVSGSLSATLAKARLPCGPFSTRLMNLCASRTAKVLEHGLGMNAGGAAVPLLERAPRHKHPRAAPAQRVASERRCIARQHDQRDLDVFAEAAGAFRKRQRACTGSELETVAAEHTRHLLVALRPGEQQGAAHHGDV